MATSSPAADKVVVEVEGERLTLSNLDKVLYPAEGFTKGAVIDYYRTVAPVLLPHLRDRPVTFRRFPDGVEGFSFYEKHLPRGAPSFVSTIAVPSRTKKGTSDGYPAIDSLAALVWAANLAVLELHVPMWRAGADATPEPPDLLVFDLDPGAPADIIDCCRVACALRARLEADGYRPLAKTSGSKGLQLYASRPPATRGQDPAEYARALAEELAADRAQRVVANMRRDLRRGKVLVDWSQNSTAKTTVAPYSLRAKTTVGVSTPLRWEEVETALKTADRQSLEFSPEAVVRRIREHGDLFAPLLASV